MTIRFVLMLWLIGAASGIARADIPREDVTRFDRIIPKPLPRQSLRVERDRNAKSAKLVLPKDLIAAVKPAESPHVASAVPTTLLGLGFTGSLIVGGLWLARMPRAKVLIGVLLLGVALIGAGLHAQPAGQATPRAVVESGKIRISRGATEGQIQLILPRKAVQK